MTNTTVETELLRNEAATDIAKRVNLADADFNWLQERLRKLAHDLVERPEESRPQACHEVRGERIDNEELP